MSVAEKQVSNDANREAGIEKMNATMDVLDGSTSRREVVGVQLDDVALASVTDFDEAYKLLEQSFGKESMLSAEELGDGFAVINGDDKLRLVGVPLICLGVSFVDGDFGKYTAAQVMTKSGEKLVIIDGSTGINKQLQEFAARTHTFPKLWAHGLRVSEYEFTDTKGNKVPAKTFYIDTSPA